MVQPSPVQPSPVQPSFEDSFPALSQSQSQSQPAVPKLNFKSAITQGQHPPTTQIQIQTQPPTTNNQFLRPINQFLQPRAMNMFLQPVNNHTPIDNRYRYERVDDDDYGDDDAVSASAYDSAYTKYYKD